MIEFKKASIDNKLLNVVSYDSFCNNKEMNNNTMTAVEQGDYVYPVRNSTDNKPGMYNDGCLNFFVEPSTEEEKEEYSVKNIKDVGNSKDINELMKNLEEINSLEREILTTPDSIFIPPQSKKDSPAMKALKDAIIAKNIDINKYQDRFGKSSFANDKRNLRGHDITLFMMNRFTKALDIKATLILEDKSPDVPNPMGQRIVVDLLNYDNDQLGGE